MSRLIVFVPKQITPRVIAEAKVPLGITGGKKESAEQSPVAGRQGWSIVPSRISQSAWKKAA